MQRLIESMDNMTLDAFIYPGWGNPPRLIGDLDQSGNTPLGMHSAAVHVWICATRVLVSNIFWHDNRKCPLCLWLMSLTGLSAVVTRCTLEHIEP